MAAPAKRPRGPVSKMSGIAIGTYLQPLVVTKSKNNRLSFLEVYWRALANNSTEGFLCLVLGFC